MNISEWYKSSEPEIINGKILICRKTSNGTALLRREAEKNGGIAGIRCMSIAELAKNTAAESLSQRAGKPFISLDTGSAASLTLMTLINSRLSELEYDKTQWKSDEEFRRHIHRILTRNTADELMRIINMIRMNKAQNKLREMAEGRYNRETSFGDDDIFRFKRLYKYLCFYTEYLKDSDVYDTVRIIEEAVSYLKELKSQNRKSVIHLPEYAVSDDLVPSKLESEFLSLIGADSRMIEAPECKAKTERFISAYGITDEIRYAAEIIAGKHHLTGNNEEKKIYPGDAAVWYTNPSYINVIRSVFAAQNIGVSFIDGLPAAETDGFMLFLDILDWIKNDCRYDFLTKLILNRAIEFRVSDNKDIAPLSKKSIIRYFSDIGFLYEMSSYKRIANGAENEQADISFLSEVSGDDESYNDPRMKKLAEVTAKKFAYDLVITVSPDDEENRMYDPEKLFARMGYFFDKYCVKHGEICRQFPSVRELVRTIKKSLQTGGKAMFTLKETEKMIRDIIENESTGAEMSSETVSAKLIGTQRIISPRKYNFIVGLSSDLMLRKTDESPVMYDAEIRQCFDRDDDERLIAGYTGSAKNDIINDTLDYLTNTLPQNSTVFYSYPNYDPVRLCVRSKTDFYDKKLRESGAASEQLYNSLDPDDKQNFLYEFSAFTKEKNTVSEQNTVDNMVEFIFAEKQKLNEQRETSENNDSEPLSADALNQLAQQAVFPDKSRLELSTTGLETLLSCPMKYACKYIYGLKEEPEAPENNLSWLDIRERGLFFHRVMELYFGSKLTGRSESCQLGTAQGIEKFDSEAFNNAVKLTEDEFSLLPVAVERIKQTELAEISNAAENYIRLMTERFGSSEYGYSPCAVEYKWQNQEKDDIIDLSAFSPDGSNAKIALNFRQGSIDRLDVKRDSNGNAHFVISDYKTGLLENFINGHTEKLVQHYIYKLSLENSMTEEKNIVVDRFEFHFPFDDRRLLYHYRNSQFVLTGSSDITSIVIDSNDVFELAGKTKQLLYNFVSSENGVYETSDRVINSEFEYDIAENRLDASELSPAELQLAVRERCRYCPYSELCGLKYIGNEEGDSDDDE